MGRTPVVSVMLLLVGGHVPPSTRLAGGTLCRLPFFTNLSVNEAAFGRRRGVTDEFDPFETCVARPEILIRIKGKLTSCICIDLHYRKE